MSGITLGHILKEHFGCKKPVLKNPKKIIDFDGCERNQYFSDSGMKAYAKLISLLSDLNELTDCHYDLWDMVEGLDSTVEGNGYDL